MVYLINASGAQIDTLPLMENRLAGMLTTDQLTGGFTVILFQGGGAIEMSPPGLKPDTPANRAAAKAWLAHDPVHARGSGDPRAALRLAFQYHPSRIFILSDRLPMGGAEADLGGLFALLDGLDPAHRTVINTVQFFDDDRQHTLQLLAQRYHGRYQFIRAGKPAPAADPLGTRSAGDDAPDTLVVPGG